MLTKITKIMKIHMKIVLVAIRKSQLASVCPWFGQKNLQSFFCAQLIVTCEKAVSKHVDEVDPWSSHNVNFYIPTFTWSQVSKK
jgi:hypothetical protein